jgi:hypothetical protein
MGHDFAAELGTDGFSAAGMVIVAVGEQQIFQLDRLRQALGNIGDQRPMPASINAARSPKRTR